jgi:murein L,D-transpeptidase YafK
MSRFCVFLVILGLAACQGNATSPAAQPLSPSPRSEPAPQLRAANLLPTSPRAERVIAAVAPRLAQGFSASGLRLGAPIYLRLFKEERVLELWVVGAAGYRLYKSYPICAVSGGLGPKIAQGDNQAPEGFYEVKAPSLNPTSFFHLSLNVGYPNDYDKAHGRTGSLIMIHGNCVSVGCYAMTDPGIDEIYTMVHAALTAGTPAIPVHIFPFRLTSFNLSRHSKDRWLGFWQELRPAYDTFEANHRPPNIIVTHGHYAIDPETSLLAVPAKAGTHTPQPRLDD